MSSVIQTWGIGKRYGDRWALEECTLSVPAGVVVGLVGPNGARKTTLLHLAVGLLSPSVGRIEVLGRAPAGDARQLASVGFVAQEAPVYRGFTVDRHLQMGKWVNPAWDAARAAKRIDELGLDHRQRAGALSGGQRAQLALTMAAAKRPQLLVLDEPVASLDPLARREFLGSLMEFVAEDGVSVVLSSHLVSDLERVCDYLIVLSDSHVQLAGELDEITETHHRLVGPGPREARVPAGWDVIEHASNDRQTSLLVRNPEPILDPTWTVMPVSVEDLVIAYMRRGKPAEARPRRLAVAP